MGIVARDSRGHHSGRTTLEAGACKHQGICLQYNRLHPGRNYMVRRGRVGLRSQFPRVVVAPAARARAAPSAKISK